MLNVFKQADEEKMLDSLADRFRIAIVDKTLNSEKLDISESDISKYLFETLDRIDRRSRASVASNSEK